MNTMEGNVIWGPLMEIIRIDSSSYDHDRLRKSRGRMVVGDFCVSYNGSDNIVLLNKGVDSLLSEVTGWHRHSPCWLHCTVYSL